jgi:hypothetical protein
MFKINTLQIKNIKYPKILILGSSLAKCNINHFVIRDIKNISEEEILNFGLYFGTVSFISKEIRKRIYSGN